MLIISSVSDPLRFLNRPLILHVARVQRSGRLEQQHLNLLLGDRAVLDASWHDEELTFFQPDVAVPVLHPESSLDHQEEFVFVIVSQSLT